MSLQFHNLDMVQRVNVNQLNPAQGAITSVRGVTFGTLAILLFGLVPFGCQAPLAQIDQQVDQLVAEHSAKMTPANAKPVITVPPPNESSWLEAQDIYERTPDTNNPSADELIYVPTAAADAQAVSDRLQAVYAIPPDAVRFDLQAALQYATRNSREYAYSQEDYLISCLDLLIEMHRWDPQFFDTLRSTLTSDSDDGFYDTSLNLINEFRVSQLLPYGGSIAAEVLAQTSEDLHKRVNDSNYATPELYLRAEIPLLRGAGMYAQRELIQQQRNVVYAARAFETFRRAFLVTISSNYLDLVVQQQLLNNRQRAIAQLERVAIQERALYEAGRKRLYDVTLAENAVLQSIDTYNRNREALQLAIDQFKVKINYPVEEPLVIITSVIGLTPPNSDMTSAVISAMALRLDLQTERNKLADLVRDVENARNQILGDLNLTGLATFNSQGELSSQALEDQFSEPEFQVGISYGVPLNRKIERLRLRRNQVSLERGRLKYSQFRDTIAIETRNRVRDIDVARFNLDLQEQNVVIAEIGVQSLEAQPERITILDLLKAIEDLRRARDGRDSARRDLEVSILQYLRDSGQLRVKTDGSIDPLEGMIIVPETSPRMKNPRKMGP
jgi:outer membrane protein TolC